MATNTAYALDVGIQAIGLDINQDFYSIPMSKACELSTLADYCNYRKPKNANGSKARYFWALLQRVHNRKGV